MTSTAHDYRADAARMTTAELAAFVKSGTEALDSADPAVRETARTIAPYVNAARDELASRRRIVSLRTSEINDTYVRVPIEVDRLGYPTVASLIPHMPANGPVFYVLMDEDTGTHPSNARAFFLVNHASRDAVGHVLMDDGAAAGLSAAHAALA